MLDDLKQRQQQCRVLTYLITYLHHYASSARPTDIHLYASSARPTDLHLYAITARPTDLHLCASSACPAISERTHCRIRKQAMSSWFSSMARWRNVCRHLPGPADHMSTSQPWRTYRHHYTTPQRSVTWLDTNANSTAYDFLPLHKFNTSALLHHSRDESTREMKCRYIQVTEPLLLTCIWLYKLMTENMHAMSDIRVLKLWLLVLTKWTYIHCVPKKVTPKFKSL